MPCLSFALRIFSPFQVHHYKCGENKKRVISNCISSSVSSHTSGAPLLDILNRHDDKDQMLWILSKGNTNIFMNRRKLDKRAAHEMMKKKKKAN